MLDDRDTGRGTRVFVSYSRRDSIFVELLAKRLEGLGYDVLLDRSGIEKGEVWWQRIVDLIISCQVAVFVISPDSILSPICNQEIDNLSAMGKRLVPVLFRTAGGAELPSALRERDWIDLAEAGGRYETAFGAMSAQTPDERAALERSFGEWFEAWPGLSAKISEVQRAIDLDDVLWMREQSVWLARAREWATQDRSEGALLRHGDITRAQTWMNKKPARAAPAPDVIAEYLAASLAKEEADRERLAEREERIARAVQKLFARPARDLSDAGAYESALRISALGVTEAVGAIEETLGAQFSRAAHHSRLERMLVGHSEHVYGAVLTPDGARAATGSADGTVRLWDVHTGDEVQRWEHYSAVTAVAISPSGAHIAAVAYDSCVFLIGLADCEKQELEHEGTAIVARFSADSSRLVVVNEPRTTTIWDVSSASIVERFEHVLAVKDAMLCPTGQRIAIQTKNSVLVRDLRADTRWQFDGESEIQSFAFDATGERIVICDREHICVVEVAGGNVLARHPNGFGAFALSPDGARFAVSAAGGEVLVCALADGEGIARCTGHQNGTKTLRWDRSGDRLVSVGAGLIGEDTAIRIWNAWTGESLALLTGHVRPLDQVEFSADGSRLISAGGDFVPRVYRTSTNCLTRKLLHVRGNIQKVRFTLNDEYVFTCATDGMIRSWRSADGAMTAEIQTAGVLSALDVSGIGAVVAAGGADGRLYLFDWLRRATVAELSGHAARVLSLSFDSTGKYLLSTCQGGRVGIWDAQTGANLRWLDVHGPTAPMAAFSADSSRVLIAGAFAEIFEVETGARVVKVEGGGGDAISASFSPDGSRLILVAEHLVTVADARTGEILRQLRTDGLISAAAFNATGELIFTAGGTRRGDARIWSVSTGKEVASLRQHDDMILALALSPDGSCVATADMNGAVQISDAVTGALLAFFPGRDDEFFVADLSFSHDGCLLVGIGNDNAARLWDMTWLSGHTASWRARAAARHRLHSKEVLTPDEVIKIVDFYGTTDLRGARLSERILERFKAPRDEDLEADVVVRRWRAGVRAAYDSETDDIRAANDAKEARARERREFDARQAIANNPDAPVTRGAADSDSAVQPLSSDARSIAHASEPPISERARRNGQSRPLVVACGLAVLLVVVAALWLWAGRAHLISSALDL